MPTPRSETSSTAQPVVPRSLPGFVDVDTLKGADGVVAVISQRRKSGELTFAIFRVFDDNRTSFIPESLMASYMAMLDLVKQRLVELKASGNLPFPVHAAADGRHDRPDAGARPVTRHRP
jgi:hypothetical protein